MPLDADARPPYRLSPRRREWTELRRRAHELAQVRARQAYDEYLATLFEICEAEGLAAALQWRPGVFRECRRYTSEAISPLRAGSLPRSKSGGIDGGKSTRK